MRPSPLPSRSSKVLAARKRAKQTIPIFVLARADHERAYVGQQVTVSYDLFYRVQLRNVSFNKLPTFVGFWTEDLFVAQQLESHQEVRGGVSYNVAPLRRVALFPTGAGTHAVGTLAVSCDIPQQRSRRGGALDDFFAGDPFFGRSRSVLRQSEELQIEVLPLPEQGRPDGIYRRGGALSSSASRPSRPKSRLGIR